MSEHLPESDWKLFRRLREVALERFCERVLGEIAGIASDGAISWHERYLRIYRLIDQRDDELARAFNGPSRSRAILQLATMNACGMLAEADLLPFTEQTRETVEFLSKPAKNTRARTRG
jgi:hypothetical protein